MSTVSSYLQISKNLDRWQKITAKKPEVALQTKYFSDNIKKVKSGDELIKNPRLFNFAMTAFGLGDMKYAKGLMQKVLQQGVASNKALANTLPNPRIQAFAKAFDFAANGASTTNSDSFVASIVARYTENAMESDVGKSNPGVELALYFHRNAPNITSIYGILADKDLLKVVETTLDLPPQMAAQQIDTQKRLLEQKLKLADLKDPKKLEAFIARFAAMYDMKNPDASGSESTGVSALLGGDAATINYNLLAQLQSAKGGFSV
jgi:hypothetical protein